MAAVDAAAGTPAGPAAPVVGVDDDDSSAGFACGSDADVGTDLKVVTLGDLGVAHDAVIDRLRAAVAHTGAGTGAGAGAAAGAAGAAAPAQVQSFVTLRFTPAPAAGAGAGAVTVSADAAGAAAAAKGPQPQPQPQPQPPPPAVVRVRVWRPDQQWREVQVLGSRIGPAYLGGARVVLCVFDPFAPDAHAALQRLDAHVREARDVLARARPSAPDPIDPVVLLLCAAHQSDAPAPQPPQADAAAAVGGAAAGAGVGVAGAVADASDRGSAPKRYVSKAECRNWAAAHGAAYEEYSAHTGRGVWRALRRGVLEALAKPVKPVTARSGQPPGKAAANPKSSDCALM